MKRCITSCLAVFIVYLVHAQEATIIDARHYSHVFGESRNYRIFLPPAYNNNPTKKFPVIYFFHGWGQRYFGEGAEEYAAFDKGNHNNGDNIANYVAKHDVIVVKWDGYNKSNDQPYDRRPYNVSPVETFRQFPIYFPELVTYIDKTYRTMADRTHRAVTGLSMGGFMTFFIAAKYPHLVSAAGSFCGSPEFEIGPREFPSEYKHLHMYRNFAGVNVRLHYGDKDFIRGYHEDMNRVLPHLMNNYSYKIFDAAHSTAGLGEMFDFILTTFKSPLPVPARWHHTDVYPNFSVWDYEVRSDRNQKGFTVLENVDALGFRVAVREIVPQGELLSSVNLSVTTAPVYEKNTTYVINDFDVKSNKASQQLLQSDESGRLTINLNGSLHEVAISKKSGGPAISVASFSLENAGWATKNKDVKLKIDLLNKGTTNAKNVQATISAIRNNAQFSIKQAKYGDIKTNTKQESQQGFVFRTNDTADVIQLKVDIADGNNNRWTEFIDIPLKKDVEEIKNFEIADGRTILVTSGGTGMKSMLLGRGNGDGIANPGESIVVLVKDNDKLWKTDLEFSDRFLNPSGVNVTISDNLTDFDHVGASAKYDVPLIAGDCPQNHSIKLFAEYWVPQYPHHIIKQGTVTMNVEGKDETGPEIVSVMVQGNNVIEARIHDGSAVKSAKALLISSDDPSKTVQVELVNDGTRGDMYAGDNIYGATIPEQKFGIYRVIIEATDSHGNTGSKESEMAHVIH